MGEPSPGTSQTESPSDEKHSQEHLDSWKEIASYVKRDVTTVQRWEKREGMPVHRHVHAKRGSVYALSSELDAWLQSRKVRLEQELRSSAASVSESAPDAATQSVSRHRQWILLGGLALFALLAAALVLARRHAGAAAQPKIASLAVLPLRNLSGDPAQEYFADGMTEALIGRLSMIRGLRVISRTSVMQFKDSRVSAPAIAQALHVDAIVEGSVMREGSRIRIHAQLIRGKTDDHFWSQTYDRELPDVLALQSEVAHSIAQKVEVTVTGEEQARLVAAREVAPEVYESYLKGEFAKNNNRADVERSISYYEDAIRQDPTFAPAYVGLAMQNDRLGAVFIGVPPGETRPKVIRAARKALELDPELATAHVLLADVQQKQGQWAEAEAEYRRALELSPNNATAHKGLANWLLCQGRTEEALAWARRARELDPLGISGADMGWILFHARRYDDAIRELRSELAVDPTNADALWFMGFVLIANGQPEEAVADLNTLLPISGRSSAVLGVLVRAYAHAGRRAEALRLLDELKRRQKGTYVPSAAFVNAYLGLGENDLALAALEQAYQEKSNILQFLKVHPHFDPIRGDPRFVDLVHRVGMDSTR